jgi:hypothetical protein
VAHSIRKMNRQGETFRRTEIKTRGVRGEEGGGGQGEGGEMTQTMYVHMNK